MSCSESTADMPGLIRSEDPSKRMPAHSLNVDDHQIQVLCEAFAQCQTSMENFRPWLVKLQKTSKVGSPLEIDTTLVLADLLKCTANVTSKLTEFATLVKKQLEKSTVNQLSENKENLATNVFNENADVNVENRVAELKSSPQKRKLSSNCSENLFNYSSCDGGKPDTIQYVTQTHPSENTPKKCSLADAKNPSIYHTPPVIPHLKTDNLTESMVKRFYGIVTPSRHHGDGDDNMRKRRLRSKKELDRVFSESIKKRNERKYSLSSNSDTNEIQTISSSKHSISEIAKAKMEVLESSTNQSSIGSDSQYMLSPEVKPETKRLLAVNKYVDEDDKCDKTPTKRGPNILNKSPRQDSSEIDKSKVAVLESSCNISSNESDSQCLLLPKGKSDTKRLVAMSKDVEKSDENPTKVNKYISPDDDVSDTEEKKSAALKSKVHVKLVDVFADKTLEKLISPNLRSMKQSLKTNEINGNICHEKSNDNSASFKKSPKSNHKRPYVSSSVSPTKISNSPKKKDYNVNAKRSKISRRKNESSCSHTSDDEAKLEEDAFIRKLCDFGTLENVRVKPPSRMTSTTREALNQTMRESIEMENIPLHSKNSEENKGMKISDSPKKKREEAKDSSSSHDDLSDAIEKKIATNIENESNLEIRRSPRKTSKVSKAKYRLISSSSESNSLSSGNTSATGDKVGSDTHVPSLKLPLRFEARNESVNAGDSILLSEQQRQFDASSTVSSHEEGRHLSDTDDDSSDSSAGRHGKKREKPSMLKERNSLSKKLSSKKRSKLKRKDKLKRKSFSNTHKPSFLKLALSESNTDSDREVSKNKRASKSLDKSDDSDERFAKADKEVSKQECSKTATSDVKNNTATSDISESESSEVIDDFDKRHNTALHSKKDQSSPTASSLSSDDTDNEMKNRPKRKRIRKELADDESDDEPTSEQTSGEGGGEDDEDAALGGIGKGRKTIRKIISDKKVSETTKEAALEERERRKRMEERQKMYNQLFQVKEGEVLSSLPLDFDAETKQPTVEVHQRLVKHLKPHQVGGVKFLWDAVFESKEKVLSSEVPGGAILAHCMGLGKTLQTITIVHTLHSNFTEQIRRVLILCPVNTVKNWVDEFDKWLDNRDDESEEDISVDVYEMSSDKDNWSRADKLKFWYTNGGILVMGYDMFRNLTNENSAKKFKKKQRDVFVESLLDPGPDLVVCDEGHVLKNLKSALNQAMNRIRTTRRIMLTGTPLQNNLSEYYAMVNFIKPNLMGSYGEFKNRFVNPIQNGQHSDSTERDFRVMKKRSFVLNDLLKGCMQRLDYSVLEPYLQPKYEYVLCIQLTDFQKKLYTYYLENFAQAGRIGEDGKLVGGSKGGLFYDVQNLSRVWNHPYILATAKDREYMRSMLKDDEEEEDSEGSLKDFIDDEEMAEKSDQENRSSDDSEDDDVIVDNDDENAPIKSSKSKKQQETERRRITRGSRKADTESGVKQDELSTGLPSINKLNSSVNWWDQFLEEENSQSEKDRKEQDEGIENPTATTTTKKTLEDLNLGSKMVILMEILKECELLGDKVLVFSQSLLSLDLIQDFLSSIDMDNEISLGSTEGSSSGCSGSVVVENSYYLGSWKLGKDYFRMDGSHSGEQRQKWCKYFNKESNKRMRLFLISTRAGGLGINLVAANRVIVFDASWNPAHDVQSMFRVYRFGQKKPVYVYRFLAKGTMEEKIYDRQVAKQSMSARVVDEHQIERHFSMNELAELYKFNDESIENRPVPKVPKDLLLAELLKKFDKLIWKYHDHDSLLENKTDENLTESERKAAWEEFENEKKGLLVSNLSDVNRHLLAAHQQALLNANSTNPASYASNSASSSENVAMVRQQMETAQRLLLSSLNPTYIQSQYRIQYPHLSEEQVRQATRAYIMQAQSGMHRKPAYDKSHYQKEMAKIRAKESSLYPGMYRYRQASLANAASQAQGSSSTTTTSNMRPRGGGANTRMPTPRQSSQRTFDRLNANNDDDDDIAIISDNSALNRRRITENNVSAPSSLATTTNQNYLLSNSAKLLLARQRLLQQQAEMRRKTQQDFAPSSTSNSNNKTTPLPSTRGGSGSGTTTTKNNKSSADTKSKDKGGKRDDTVEGGEGEEEIVIDSNATPEYIDLN